MKSAGILRLQQPGQRINSARTIQHQSNLLKQNSNNINNLKINHNYIENIWNKLQSSTNIVSNPKDYVQDSWGLYIVHCELLKNHEYLII